MTTNATPIDTVTISTLDDLPVLFNDLKLDSLPIQVQQTIAMVDACLPQTQCGLCEHPDGCLPYATAIVVQGEAHNKCVPGGQPVSDAIATITGRHPLPAVASKWKVDNTSLRPTEVRAIIREEDCIGCTKCIPACPVDAIVGTGKHMHTIFTDLCTGCELCLPPCPVDCIDLVNIERTLTPSERIIEQNNLRERYYTHLDRVASQMQDDSNARPVISMVETKVGNATRAAMPTNVTDEIDEKTAKATIQAAKLRTKIKKLKKQLSVRPSAAKQTELETLQSQLQQLTDAPMTSD